MVASQVALITGGTDGIGLQVAYRLARGGAQLVLIGRSIEKGEKAVRDLRAAVPSVEVRFQPFDLSCMREVERLADWVRANLPKLDLLVHCAGVMLPRRILTAEGLETVFAVQYIARFYLTQRLLDHLNANARVITVSAGGMFNFQIDFGNLNGEKYYNGVIALIHESLANDLLALMFNDRYPAVKTSCYGPFYVRTTLLREMPAVLRFFAGTFGRLMAITPEQAADDVVALLASDLPGGLYGRKLKPAKVSRYKRDPAVRARLWTTTESLIQQAVHVQPV
ncbi:MAG: SDR family NAD(P)-dependent oxidoreductase [Anaerolineae bacterium]